MKVQLLDHFRAFLLRSPFYTSAFITVREWSEPTLVMRVEELSSFQQREYRAHIAFRAWRSRQGTWVVAVPFQIDVHPRLHVQGVPCLNPRHEVDDEVMQKFVVAEHVRFLFLSADLEEAEEVQVAWPAAQRTRVRYLLKKIAVTLTGEKLTSVFDPDFEHARQELMAFFSAVMRMEREEQWQR